MRTIPGVPLDMYSESLALAADQYQFTMMAAYHQMGTADRDASFTYYFRTMPYGGGYAITAGLGYLNYFVQFLAERGFSNAQIDFLRRMKGIDDKALFRSPFLEYLEALKWRLTIDAIPEGNLVFGWEPIVRVRGPLAQCQFVETFLLCAVNFQTLIATKAARICREARGEPVSEQGFRRAQGLDGAISATRAAFIGGCRSTSNVQASFLLNIPVAGTMAHAFPMSCENELAGFQGFANAMPNNCVLLVDTWDTLRGVENAATVGLEMKARGQHLRGIRLDSGDLAQLSKDARRILDERGLDDTEVLDPNGQPFGRPGIYGSNDLDEYTINSLKAQGAKITHWGVGTALVTGGTQSALGGVYKLGATKDKSGKRELKLKLAENPIKTSIPGELQVRRFRAASGMLIADAIYDEELGISDQPLLVDPMDSDRRLKISPDATGFDLLAPTFFDGRFVGEALTLRDLQDRVQSQLGLLSDATLRLDRPTPYPAWIEEKLATTRREMTLSLRRHDVTD